jgi:hypothetical protein
MALALVAIVGCKDKDKKPDDQAKQTDRQSQKPGQRPELKSSDVKGPGVEPVGKLSVTISYTRKELAIDGVPFADVGPDGLIGPARVETLISELETKVTSDDPVGVLLEPELAYLRIAHFVGHMKRAGFRSLVLLSGSGDQMIPLELRDSNARGGSVQPIVTVRDGHVILWSGTGLEGTRTKPKLDFVFVKTRNFKPLSDALVELVQRRWPNGTRPPDDFTIVLDLDRNETADTLLHVAAVVRAHGSLQLFPKVALLGGL